MLVKPPVTSAESARPIERSRLLPLAALLAVLSALVRWPSDASGLQASSQPGSPPESLDSLRARIASHISQPVFDAAEWGLKIVSLDTGKLVFEHKPNKYFNPASNTKLYTCALALDRLGQDFRIRTSLYAAKPPDASGRIKGDLVVYGRGDPTIAARLNGGDYYKALEPLVSSLAEAGVRRIEGDLIGDDSYFRGPPFGSGWEWDNLQWYYGAEVSALSINDNSVDLFVAPADRTGAPCQITTGPIVPFVTVINRTRTGRKGDPCRISVYKPVAENVLYVSGCMPPDAARFSGSVAVHNPANYCVTLFKEALARRGISVTGKVRTVDWKQRDLVPIDLRKLVELGFVESPPLRDIVRETLKPSQNLYAQLLLLQVGANGDGIEEGRSFEPTSEEVGIEMLKRFLDGVGMGNGDVVIEEGSGLSRRNMITPEATVALLVHMNRHRWKAAFTDALPIAGVDGTLKGRMKGTPAADNVRAKTGTLRFVSALSGYVTTASGEPLAFAIMLNNYVGENGGSSPRDMIDAIAVMLAGFTGRT